MKSLTLLSGLFLVASSTIVAQAKQIKEIKPFKTLIVEDLITVVYTQSDTLLLAIDAHKGEIDHISIKQKNDVLTIGCNGYFRHDCKVYVNANNLQKLSIDGAVKFITTNRIKADSLVLNVLDCSTLNAQVNSRKLFLNIDGASKTYLSGNTVSLKAELTDVSTFDGYSLKTNTVVVNSSGACNANIYTSEKITAYAEDCSTINIKGNPTELSTEASDASIIAKIKDKD